MSQPTCAGAMIRLGERLEHRALFIANHEQEPRLRRGQEKVLLVGLGIPVAVVVISETALEATGLPKCIESGRTRVVRSRRFVSIMTSGSNNTSRSIATSLFQGRSKS